MANVVISVAEYSVTSVFVCVYSSQFLNTRQEPPSITFLMTLAPQDLWIKSIVSLKQLEIQIQLKQLNVLCKCIFVTYLNFEEFYK